MPTKVINDPYVRKNNQSTSINWSASIVKFGDEEDLQTKLNQGKLGGASTASEVMTSNDNTVQQELDEIKNLLEHTSHEYSVVNVPTISNLMYNGSEQTVQIDGFNSSAMTKTGDLTVTEPGEYSITFTLKNYWKWSDDTTEAKTVTFNVDKIAPSFTRTPASLVLNAENPTGTITYSTDSNGELSVTSTDSSVASVSLNGTVATVTGLANGAATIQGSVAASTRYSATSILSTPISVSLLQRIGLLWDGSGFYRVDQNLNVISDSNFNPETTFPYSEISTETVDGYSGVTWPVVYTHAENAPTAEPTYGRVWWIDSAPSEDNHVCPSFVADGVIKNKLWLKATLESSTEYNVLRAKAKNTVMNFYDYSLMQKLILIEYNTSTNPPQNSLAASATWRNLQNAWGYSYSWNIFQWIFGADMIKSGQHEATVGSGNLRILNPRMDGSFIDTGLSPSYKWIKGNFNIGTVNGINMGDFMFDTSSESNKNGSLTISPFAFQGFDSAYAFYSFPDNGILGFNPSNPNNSDNVWRLRKVL